MMEEDKKTQLTIDFNNIGNVRTLKAAYTV